jgi:hypothetical protein
MHFVNRRISTAGAVALGLSVFLAVPAAQAKQPEAAPTTPATATIYVSSGFDQQLEDTRAHGHYELAGTGLHIWTDGSDDVVDGTNTDKVAEYVDTKTPLAKVGDASLDYANTDPNSGLTGPGFQLVVDLDGNGTPDGILVGEPASYGDVWWLSGPSKNVDLPGAPGPAFGYVNAGSLEQWNGAFQDAAVLAFGFSLGSGVHGDGVLNAINFAGTRYTFDAVVLTSKDQCKGGGWTTSTWPAYSNQGECVSHFATASNNGNGHVNGNGNGDTGLGAPVSTPTATGATAVLTARNSGKIRAI